MIGVISLFLACVTSIISVFAYANRYMKEQQQPKNASKSFHLGAFCYKLSSIFTIFASIFLMYAILNDQFQYKYIWSYSSADLLLSYKVAVFWAGQEGSFLFWLLIHSIIGLYLLYKKSMNTPAFAAYTIVQALLAILLMLKNPFVLQTASAAHGMGLNPLLQDFWMVIHPPIIFIGYAMLAIPFAYAIGGLITSKHKEWMEKALPWTLTAWGFLGAGIFIGGYWAYKTLGWGGYWGWDPVENSSLIPWLTSCALVHMLVTVRSKPGAFKLVYITAIYSFLLVLYGTFLTRSGVLSDFSVHSFSADGSSGVLFCLIFGLATLATFILALKWSSIFTAPIYTRFTSREFVISAGAIVFLGLAALVTIGTSTPLISSFFSAPQNVSSDFYNNASLPLTIIMLLLVTIFPYLKWSDTAIFHLKNYLYLLLPVGLGIALCIYVQIYQPLYLLAVAFGFTTITTNSLFLGKRISIPASIAHIGLALLCIGIILSSAGNKSETLTFTTGSTNTLFGYNISYVGEVATDTQKENIFFIQNTNTQLSALTKLNKQGQESAREPAIYKTFMGDLYFAPVHKHEQKFSEIKLTVNTPETTDDCTFTLTNIIMDKSNGMDNITVTADLTVEKGDKSTAITLQMLASNGQFKAVPQKIFDDTYELSLRSVNAGKKEITIARLDIAAEHDAMHTIDIDISYKPFVWLLWLGCTLITLGCISAVIPKNQL